MSRFRYPESRSDQAKRQDDLANPTMTDISRGNHVHYFGGDGEYRPVSVISTCQDRT
jgi:hypothetical protein